MKKLIVICSILLAGCYIQTPAKILKHPSLYGVPIIIDTQWDGNYPVREWIFKAEYGQEFTDFQNRVWRIEKDPFDTNIVVFIHDVLR